MTPTKLTPEEQASLVDQAIAGDQTALEALLESVNDLVFNLSLRFLGTICDAEDATQEIAVKIMTHLSTFRKESAFSTWVYRIAVNHLKDCRTHQFAHAPFSFEMYGADICDKRALEVPDLTEGVDTSLLARELKLSCTNVMLQCLDADARCAYVLGTMFKANSSTAADILGITPEAYRQRLSRARKTVAEFLAAYCQHGGSDACSCERRVNFAIATHRLTPNNLEYTALTEAESAEDAFIDAMDELDGYACLFDELPAYRSTPRTKKLLAACMKTQSFGTVVNTGKEVAYVD
ncbi:RNA polymerase sigma factor [Raoultibacter phocaeensis]|uniref:RNA polymerase sigma factor n=1 Tax=Raoultibacter phocaeensis TaxID=2479841 RepID=UPI00111960C9|nr:RNA polymerase sigma factor [Raoultibacter phocaeensis]